MNFLGSSGGVNLRNRRRGGGCSALIGGPLFVLIGIAVFYFMRGTLIDAYASKSWPTVQGRVTQSEMTQHRDNKNAVMYTANIAYDYTVDGQQYTSYRVGLVDGSTSVRGSVQDTLKRYPTGTAATVYYDPADPASAVLEPGFTGGVLTMGALVLCFPVAGLLAFIGGIGLLLRGRF